MAEDASGVLWRESIVRRGANAKRRRVVVSQDVAELYVAEPQDRDELAAFELDNDPDIVRFDDAQRSYAGQFRRRLRRLRERERHRAGER